MYIISRTIIIYIIYILCKELQQADTSVLWFSVHVCTCLCVCVRVCLCACARTCCRWAQWCVAKPECPLCRQVRALARARAHTHTLANATHIGTNSKVHSAGASARTRTHVRTQARGPTYASSECVGLFYIVCRPL